MFIDFSQPKMNTTCAKEDEGMIRQIHPLWRLGNLAQRCGRIQLLRFQRSSAKMEGRHGGGIIILIEVIYGGFQFP